MPVALPVPSLRSCLKAKYFLDVTELEMMVAS